jgi:adenylate kinase
MNSTIKKFSDFIEERVLPDKQGEIVVLVGPPGSGKGTLAKSLVEEYEFQHISTGDLIRNSEDEELKKIISKGEMVPDDKMIEILEAKINELDLEKNIVLDGYPRNLEQAKQLDKMLGKMGVGLSHAIFINIGREEAIKRIQKRSETENRSDDSDFDVINKRFDEYLEKTFPLVDLYKKSRKLIEVDGSTGKEKVLNSVVKSLGLKKAKA